MRRTLSALVALGMLTAVLAVDGAGAAPDDGPFTATQLDVGEDLACALAEDGVVWCWGRDVGASLESQFVPRRMEGLGEVRQITAGCALLADTTVRCWGPNGSGALGDGTTVGSGAPVAVTGLSGVEQVHRSLSHTCALLADTTVRCWGANDRGQLGDGTTDDSSVPVTVSGLTGAVAVRTGRTHTCAVLDDATVRCWGANDRGQLGDGTTDDRATPVAVTGLSSIHQVSPGDAHTCALETSGVLYCWGSNSSGELGQGDGQFDDAPTPQQVPIPGAVEVDAGSAYTCAVLVDATPRCWGENSFGQLGTGDFSASATPVALAAVGALRQVSTGTASTCGISYGGQVRCWGAAFSGQLGNSIGRTSTGPVRPADLAPVELTGVAALVSLASSARHVCAVESTGVVVCWGDNGRNQLGSLPSGIADVAPRAVETLPDATAVATGADHSCAVLEDTTVRCWGANDRGQLGDGTTDDSPAPVTVSGLTGVTVLAARGDHTCAVLNGGTVQCWGANGDGQLGDGTTDDSPVPVTVAGLAAATDVALTTSSTCALLADGTARCWGSGADGRLGNGQTLDSPTPVAVSGLTDVTDVVGGDDHLCAIVGLTVSCWGANGRGQLGDGTTGASASPKVVPGLSTLAVALGGEHSCAALLDDTVQCWGANGRGQLGDGTTDDSLTRVTVGDLSDVVTVVAGSEHTCARHSDGSVHCWGRNLAGELATLYPVAPAARPPTAVTTVAPARLLDTRPGGATTDDLYVGGGTTTPGQTVVLDVAGRGDIPDDATGVLVNVTAVNPAGQGFVTAHPCLDPRPGTASLNHPAGVTTGNELLVTLDPEGFLCLFTHTATDLTVDAVGFVPADSSYVPVGPERLLDTRDTQPLPAGVAESRPVGGLLGLPNDAAAVVMNVTAVSPPANGFLTVYPCTDIPPTASSLNYRAGVTRGNEIVVPLSAVGAVCLFANRTIDITIDVVGYLQAGAAHRPLTPARLLDTRQGTAFTTIDGLFSGFGAFQAGEQRALTVGGRGGVVTGARLVVLNVTAVDPAANGFLTVHGCLPQRPGTASLNYRAGITAGSEIVVALGDGAVCIHSNQPTDVTVDVVGYAGW